MLQSDSSARNSEGRYQFRGSNREGEVEGGHPEAKGELKHIEERTEDAAPNSGEEARANIGEQGRGRRGRQRQVKREEGCKSEEVEERMTLEQQGKHGEGENERANEAKHGRGIRGNRITVGGEGVRRIGGRCVGHSGWLWGEDTWTNSGLCSFLLHLGSAWNLTDRAAALPE